ARHGPLGSCPSPQATSNARWLAARTAIKQKCSVDRIAALTTPPALPQTPDRPPSPPFRRVLACQQAHHRRVAPPVASTLPRHQAASGRGGRRGKDGRRPDCVAASGATCWARVPPSTATTSERAVYVWRASRYIRARPSSSFHPIAPLHSTSG